MSDTVTNIGCGELPNTEQQDQEGERDCPERMEPETYCVSGYVDFETSLPG